MSLLLRCVDCIILYSCLLSIMTSPKGWTDRELCEKWFEEVFVPFANSKCISHDKLIVLNLDGHDSHESTAMKRLGQKHNIVIFCFPSKCTHKLQPLDVAVFSSVQRAWPSHCDKQLAEGVAINRYNVVHEYLKIWHVITPDLMKKAFAKTRIYPFNPEIFTDEDFAPSMASSTVAHVPPSYPTEVPSSPPADDDPDSNEDPDYFLTMMGSFSDLDCKDDDQMDENNPSDDSLDSLDHAQFSESFSPQSPHSSNLTFIPPMTPADFEHHDADNQQLQLLEAMMSLPLPTQVT